MTTKNKDYKFQYHLFQFNKVIILIHFTITIKLFFQIISKKIFNSDIVLNSSNITLKIKGIGYKNIFGFVKSNSAYTFPSSYYPDIIYINNEQKEVNYSYYLNEEDNFIELIWDKDVKSCKSMFRKTEIYELDLSNFDSSLVTNMSYMFSGCELLLSLNLSNLNTSSVKTMRSMFFNCLLLSSLDISSFDTSSVTSMKSMFYNCYELNSLDLSNLNTNLVNTMSFMFYSCESLLSLDLSHFNTSNVTSMDSLFCYCYSLRNLDVSNFNTSLVTNMDFMFHELNNLTSLNIKTFDTSKVTSMYAMFSLCYSLTELDLSSFNTINVVNMSNFVSGCISLTSLDLSNFIINKTLNMDSMFEVCSKLEYLNIKNFYENENGNFSSMFQAVANNLVTCIDDSNNTNTKILEELNILNCYTIDCSDNWKSKQKPINKITGNCIDDSFTDTSTNIITSITEYSSNIESKYTSEFNIKINTKYTSDIKSQYETETFIRSNTQYISNDNIIFNSQYISEYNKELYKSTTYELTTYEEYKCKLEKCLTCSVEAFEKDLCNECNINYYPKENDSSNILNYINCYKKIEGYFLDKDDLIYKKCYYTCDSCEIKGNNITHNCIKCNQNYSYEIENNNYTNCYENIQDIIQILLSNETKEKNGEKEDEIKYYNTLLKSIEIYLTSENYNLTFLDLGNKETIETNKMKVTLCTTQYQKNLIENMTSINLGKCENTLRNYYNISDTEFLYMRKIEVIQEKMKIPYIEYDIYSKLNDNNLTKLNLSLCKNNKAYISLPIEIKENIDELNISSGYYHDICYLATSEYGTDITLDDRKKEYIEQNKSVCQQDCIFSEYNYTSQRVNCSCDIKSSSSSFSFMNINKTKLLENFINIGKYTNINILKCYKEIFNKKGLFFNVGGTVTIIAMLFYIITVLIFYIRHLKIIWNNIKDIIFGIKNMDLIKQEEIKDKNRLQLNIKKENSKNKIENNKTNITFPKKLEKKVRKRQNHISSNIERKNIN